MNKSTIGNRVSFEYGFSVRVSEEADGYYPVFGSNGITGYIDTYKVEGPGVIIGRKGSVGKVVYTDECFTPTDTAYYLKIKDPKKDDLRFWSYFLPILGIEKLNSHSAVPGLSRELAYLIECSIPDISIQQKVANVLAVIDAKIELNNRINAELEAMAKTLYDYWFVQFNFPFDFAQGKPTANGNPYKTSGGKMVYNPILKREIPEGWEVTKIGTIAKTVLGGTPDTGVDEYWKNADIPWLSSAEIASFPVITSEQKITQLGIENSAAALLPKGTVVISIVRYIRPSILGIDAATNQSVVGIKESSRLKSSFIYPYFCNEVPRLMGLRTGAQQPHINKGVIEDSSIALPPDDILESYYEITTPIYGQVMSLAFQNHELTKLRDWLLPMLMSGQITVK